MINDLFKYFSRIFIEIVLLALLSADGSAQSFTSPISWHHTVYEARVSALGQSTAALHNRTSYHMNPAIPLESGVLSASSFLFSATAFESTVIPDGASLHSPSIGYSSRGFSYSVLMDYTSFINTHEPNSGGGNYSNSLLRFQTGYQINESFSIGAGFLYSFYKSPIFNFNGENFGGDATAWGINLGGYYRNQFESDSFDFRPQAGLSLNDLSDGFNFESTEMNEINLPGQIRLGLGLDISSKNLRHNRPLFGGGIYSGFSKYLARWEMDGQSSQITSPSGFEALFKTWTSFERFNGTEMVEISLGEQISTSLGFEFHYLETFYLRYGIVGGSDYWIRPQNGLGAEVDLYYLSLAVTHLNYHSSDRWGPQDNSTFVQATFRLPIDGQSSDTLLSRLFGR
ncbi:MAG: hypothetical protein WEA58_02195 [Balneolaceae bacterium]